MNYPLSNLFLLLALPALVHASSNFNSSNPDGMSIDSTYPEFTFPSSNRSYSSNLTNSESDGRPGSLLSPNRYRGTHDISTFSNDSEETGRFSRNSTRTFPIHNNYNFDIRVSDDINGNGKYIVVGIFWVLACLTNISIIVWIIRSKSRTIRPESCLHTLEPTRFDQIVKFRSESDEQLEIEAGTLTRQGA